MSILPGPSEGSQVKADAWTRMLGRRATMAVQKLSNGVKFNMSTDL